MSFPTKSRCEYAAFFLGNCLILWSYFDSLRMCLLCFYLMRLFLVVFSVGSHHFCTRFTSCISHTSEEKEETPTGSVHHQDCEEEEKTSSRQHLCPREEKETQAGFLDRRCSGASLASSFSSRLVESWNVCSRSTLVRSWLHLAELLCVYQICGVHMWLVKWRSGWFIVEFILDHTEA